MSQGGGPPAVCHAAAQQSLVHSAAGATPMSGNSQRRWRRAVQAPYAKKELRVAQMRERSHAVDPRVFPHMFALRMPIRVPYGFLRNGSSSARESAALSSKTHSERKSPQLFLDG